MLLAKWQIYFDLPKNSISDTVCTDIRFQNKNTFNNKNYELSLQIVGLMIGSISTKDLIS